MLMMIAIPGGVAWFVYSRLDSKTRLSDDKCLRLAGMAFGALFLGMLLLFEGVGIIDGRGEWRTEQ